MRSVMAASVGLLGLLLTVSGLALWVLGDQTSALVPLPLAITGIPWAPLIWVLGIIVMLSTALAQTLRVKNYIMWIALLVVGYLAVFAVLVSFTSLILQ